MNRHLIRPIVGLALLAVGLTGCSGGGGSDVLGFAGAGKSLSGLPADRYDSVVAGIAIGNTTGQDIVLINVTPVGVRNARIGDISIAPIQDLPDGTSLMIMAAAPPLSGTELRAWRQRTAVRDFVVRPGAEAEWNALYEMRPIDPSKEARTTGVRITFRIGRVTLTETVDDGVCFAPAGQAEACQLD